MNDDEERKHQPRFQGSILDLDPDDRWLRWEPIIDTEELDRAVKEQRAPYMKGIAIHQHSRVPIVDLDGVTIQEKCDYIELSVGELMYFKNLLNTMTHINQDGSPVEEEDI